MEIEDIEKVLGKKIKADEPLTELPQDVETPVAETPVETQNETPAVKIPFIGNERVELKKGGVSRRGFLGLLAGAGTQTSALAFGGGFPVFSCTEEYSPTAAPVKTFDYSSTTGAIVLSQVSASLNFADDTAAAAGGIPLGGLYRNGNFIAIRLT